VKNHEKADTIATQFEIGEQLRLVNWQDSLDSFELKHNFVMSMSILYSQSSATPL
jgi:hypothetical protein